MVAFPPCQCTDTQVEASVKKKKAGTELNEKALLQEEGMAWLVDMMSLLTLAAV